MKYVSTREKSVSISPSKAIIQGLSMDGGLFVPSEIPRISLKEILDMDYKELAYHIMGKYFSDFKEEELKDCIEKAYDDKFDSEAIAPIKKVGDNYFLELYHGPTLAFKDMALSILPYLVKTAMKVNDIKEEVVILTATSGDTGKAALEGFANVAGVKIIVFFPEDGVSQVQKLQMKTQEGDNTFVVGIDGNFDDAQNGVKEIFNDRDFVKKLKENNFILSSANSINIGRLVPQIVYYFNSYISLLRSGEIILDEKINVAVPTGNFGNILAAYYAKKMGLPIDKLICASNDNNVLTDFLNSGIYDRRRELKLTSSPSMDILISSNLERLLYHLNLDDSEFIDLSMKQLKQRGFYKMDKDDFEDFIGDYSTEAEVASGIKEVFDRYGYLMDTHTSVAYNVVQRYKFDYYDDTKTLIASTASPFKFANTVAASIGIDVENQNEFVVIEELSKKTNMEIPPAIGELKDKKILHNRTIKKEDMKIVVENILKVGAMND